MKVEWAPEYSSEQRAPGPGQRQLDTAMGKWRPAWGQPPKPPGPSTSALLLKQAGKFHRPQSILSQPSQERTGLNKGRDSPSGFANGDVRLACVLRNQWSCSIRSHLCTPTSPNYKGLCKKRNKSKTQATPPTLVFFKWLCPVKLANLSMAGPIFFKLVLKLELTAFSRQSEDVTLPNSREERGYLFRG